jgi:hypothetical protein
MIVAAFGYLPPLAGAILQEAIDVAVIVNALRVLRIASPRSGRGTLDAAHVDRLKTEHDELGPVLDRVRAAADRLVTLPTASVRTELLELDELLRGRLLPHEHRDDAELYPTVARMLGGEDPMAAMSRTHREIMHLALLLHRMILDLPAEGPDPAVLRELQHILYGLDAILRLHFAQEEEIYHALADAA